MRNIYTTDVLFARVEHVFIFYTFCSPIPLDNKRFLPRGSVLRDTKWIYGAVIYTGHETKLMLNKIIDRSKESAMDKIVNSQIRIMFLLMFLLSFVYAICYTWWIKEHLETHWYLNINGNETIFMIILHAYSSDGFNIY